MPVKKFRPVTPALRWKTVSDFAEITRSTPEKSLLEPQKSKGGRNNLGRVTSRHRGGGHKRMYRRIDFRRDKEGVPANVVAIEYDPNRSARIALLHYADGEKRYIIAPVGLDVGRRVMSGIDAEFEPGNSMPLSMIPVGTVIHAVELVAGKGAQLARSAGASVQLMAKEGNYAQLRLPSGEMRKVRLPASAYLGIVAATNMKQRSRKQLEYYHADRLNFAVLGTPNRLEYDQGFFVKNGDGAADIKPIAHLYKSQVYQLAAHLGVPTEILSRPPTTDTYSLPQTQEEFYFALPYDKMDVCLYGLNHALPAAEIAAATGLSSSQVELVWTDITAKRKVARYLHSPPLTLI